MSSSPVIVPPTEAVRFQGWEIRPAQRLLLIDGAPAALGGRAFEVLATLVARRGQVVGKQELLEAAWPGLIVEENNISVQIAALRKLLGAQAIKTVAGLGYQLGAAPLDEPAAARPARPAAARGDVALVGREPDLAAVVERLQDGTRLLSLIGTGGVGKTSLARALLARLDGALGEAHWIDLAPLRDATPLVSLLAKAFGIEIEGRHEGALALLVGGLGGAETLLVLDNCEHLVAEIAPLLHQLLNAAPGLRCLATSQEPLRLAGEQVYRLAPLDVPAPDATLEQARANPSVALLCQRAQAADRHFVLDEEGLAQAVELCRQLDGLPLAIEMAAARVGSLGLASVHEQLGQRMRVLAGPRGAPARHMSLRSTFDWSYGLLTPAEQKVFRRLQPFLGGFGAAMARQVTRDPEDVRDGLDELAALEVLATLVDKSLVQRIGTAAQPRFHLFESARDYAATWLAQSGEADAVRRRHAHVVAAWFDEAHTDFVALRDAQWAARYLPERHNVRAALSWACEARESDVLASLVAALAMLDLFAHQQAEIVQLEIPMDVLGDALPSLRAAACLELAAAHYADGSRERATELAQRALADYRAIGDVVGRYRALAQLIRLYESRHGMQAEAAGLRAEFRRIDEQQIPLRTRLTSTIMGNLPQGPDEDEDGPEGAAAPLRPLLRYQELQALTERCGFDALAAVCRCHITDELLIEGRFEEAVQAAQGHLDAGESRPRVKAMILANQAFALVQLGRVPEAWPPTQAALRAYPGAVHIAADTFALAAAREQRFVDAALMAGFGAAVRRARDHRPDPAEATAIAETRARLQQALAPERLAALLRDGAAMPAAQLLAMAEPPALSGPPATDAR